MTEREAGEIAQELVRDFCGSDGDRYIESHSSLTGHALVGLIEKAIRRREREVAEVCAKIADSAAERHSGLRMRAANSDDDWNETYHSGADAASEDLAAQIRIRFPQETAARPGKT